MSAGTTPAPELARVATPAPAPNDFSARLPKLFLVLGIFFTFAYAAIVPPFQVSDEDRHLWRAYSVSEFHFVAQQQTQIPLSFIHLHDRFWPFLEMFPEKRIVHFADLEQWLRKPLDSESRGVENPAANLYTFVPYLPAAFAIRLGRTAGWSALGLFYAARLANAAVYLFLMYLSLRMLPEFRLLLLTIALSPTSLNLAASLSGDSFTLALVAFFTALVFRLAFDDRIKSLRPRDLVLLLFLASALALCKSNVWVPMLVFVIPARKFASRRKALLFGAACMLVGVWTAWTWQRINAPAASAFRIFEAGKGISVPDNIAFLLHHPVRFSAMIVLTDIVASWRWLQEFIGRFGWLTIPLSPVHVVMYASAIALAACTSSATITMERWQKRIIATFVLLTIISLHALLFIFETPASVLRNALTEWMPIRELQGRYFIPIALPALALLGKRRFPLDGLLLVGALAVVVIINAIALSTIWQVYT